MADQVDWHFKFCLATMYNFHPGGGVLPYNSYTGMSRPTGSYFWDSDLKRGIIFKPFSRTGNNFSNVRKLQNQLSAILIVERGIKNLPIF